MIIGYAYVVGDILHDGHLMALENAKSFCDKLIVGVLTKKAVLEKKPEPTIDFRERLRLVKSLKFVDATVTQETYSPVENIKSIRPDILFESTSHDERILKKSRNWTELYGGRVIVMPYFLLQSSTKIKEKIRGKS